MRDSATLGLTHVICINVFIIIKDQFLKFYILDDKFVWNKQYIKFILSFVK